MPKSKKSSSFDLSYFEETITLSDRKEIPNSSAYRMDGNTDKNIKNMASFADLGTLSCCDYLYFHSNTEAVLIEDTYFGVTLRKELSDMYSYTENINNNKEPLRKYLRKKLIEILIKKDIHIKVYGAFIILCRLEKKYKEVANKLAGKNFLFWFIINDEGDIRAIDNLNILDLLKNDFKQKLEGNLNTAKLVKDTQIFLKRSFIKKLQEHQKQ